MSAEFGFHDFKVIQRDGTPFKTILLDGREMRGVVSVSVEMEVNALSRVRLEMLTDRVELDLKNEAMDVEETAPDCPVLYEFDKPIYKEEREKWTTR